MKNFHTTVCPRVTAAFLLAAMLNLLSGFLAHAEGPRSLLPAFGNEGAEFTVKGQNGHGTKGWLPKDWTDNTEWAQVNATYSKLADSPDKAAGAVRIKVEKVDEGQLQLTTYQGQEKYQKGKRYIVTGWVRSAEKTSVQVGVRQKGEPYEFYHEQELTTGPEWKRFEFAFTPAMDFEAFVMFVIRETGTVDLAGVALEERAQ
jgi:hypothetical protein